MRLIKHYIGLRTLPESRAATVAAVEASGLAAPTVKSEQGPDGCYRVNVELTEEEATAWALKEAARLETEAAQLRAAAERMRL